MTKKRAIVTGVTGQDGYYMAELLVSKGYDVYCTIRHFNDINRLGGDTLFINIKATICPIDLLDRLQVISLIKSINPDEIYNFAAISNVFDPWVDTDLTFDVNIKIPKYFLEGIISMSKNTKFLQASSSLVFGRDEGGVQNELTPRNPIYPYGVSKNAVDNLINEARLTYGIKACSAIFFNHESPRRRDTFFSKKIARAVADIKAGNSNTISVGNVNSYRDYGYAVDYMEAAFLMLQQDTPKDYVIGTSELTMMSDYVKKCFSYAGLHWENHIYVDGSLYRENDTKFLRADISKIKNDLGWVPKTDIDALVKIMMEDALSYKQ